MKLKGIYSSDKTVLSYEIFPPKNDETGEKTEKLYTEVDKLNKFSPALISVTYGAGGSNKDHSLSIVQELCKRKINVMPHFTCVCSNKEQINKYLGELNKLNIENILALKGDEPQDCLVCHRDFRYANELVEYLKLKTDFSIAVAGYPECHIEAPDLQTDIKNLKLKINAGADVIFTQMFFDNSKFFKYIELLDKENINIPVCAGILPILSYQQLDKMLSLANVSVPKKLMENLERFKDNKDDVKKLGIDFATEQCAELIENGVKGLHFFTLNKAYSTTAILKNLTFEVCSAKQN